MTPTTPDLPADPEDFGEPVSGHPELEPVLSPPALTWAEERTRSTMALLDSPGTDVDRIAMESRIHRALDTDDRIAFPNRRGGHVYNFWRDAGHPRGLWRRTSPEDYRAGSPDWEILLDLDALATAESENWVWHGAHVRSPDRDRALIRLSRGGADAVVIREFDLVSGTFVTDRPFTVPEAKTTVSWIDRDTILIGTDTGDGSLTGSGYPARVLRWRRGEPLTDAELYFAGPESDITTSGWADTTPGHERLFVRRALDFYRQRTFVETDAGLQIIEVPEDCEVSVHRGRLFVFPRTGFGGVPDGGMGVADLDTYLAGDHTLECVFAPSPSTALEGLTVTRHHLILTVTEAVSTVLLTAPLDDPAGELTRLDVPGLATVSVIDTAPLDDDQIWLASRTFTEPVELLWGDLADGPGALELHTVGRAPEMFDASGLSTRQHHARSADGTTVPYFITGRFGDSADGAVSPRPCLVHAYGGFEVSLLPNYLGSTGIGWLEEDRLFVQANLRGGGEFGPAWHSSATGPNRLRVHEDHEAILIDLVERGYTTPERLAVWGGSNGGLVAAVALTRYPERFGAAVVQVPLTDMLRYHRMSAGASWTAEYGDPDDPEFRGVLEEYSPLHNVVPRSQRPYPPALVTTSTRDDRVHPAHARLFAAALADAGQPVDYHENTEGGHGGAADNAQRARLTSVIFAWLDRQVGHGPTGAVLSAHDD
ncbi:prolyl oligopeptidase family serine peptidase [Corynebacterium pygosceleis]|uniref:prolyl oligopeptidase family serine peptidase n=1 Tax=Corynebacterium pygosceleis TaxID=2800406 RepID=UPI0019073C95|nr:prolyl oligopeptidase family serine peptidase [Corynebacterium pygosceleis]MCK7676049.1 prolyl oligopeptidase family serine peptidase [Corynebacterium pygosceleis]MCL0119825.1 prolyl oligopeptidase family serine peptidase [Corynebacterium pygosceleis]